jgi:ethanolaminephosphotransferase
MSSTASNYDVTHLIIGTSLAGLSVILAFFTLPALLPASPQGLAYTLILLLYTILMFASSYVEEEHNFWYWATSAWLFYLFIASSRKQWTSKFFLHPAIMVLVLHRIIRRWNQTGQKFAGADDIVHSLFFSGRSSILLWVLVGATYLDIINRLARHVTRSISSFEGTSGVTYGGPGDDFDANRFMGTLAVLPLGGTAFVFKLAFTTADAPELTVGINEGILTWVAGLGLTGMARMVFGGTVLIGFWITVSEWKRAKGRRKGVNGNGGKSSLILQNMLMKSCCC